MSRRGRRMLWGLVGLGLAGRLIVAFTTLGQPFDVKSAEIVLNALQDRGFDLYSSVNGGDQFRWPYPPGFLPWFEISDFLEAATGADFRDLIQIPAILADAAIALVLSWFLGHRGAGEGARLGAVAAVMLGPVFALISGYHTQLDSVAILPALAGVLLWVARPADRWRWLYAGLLIGVGASLKTTPAVVVLALLPTARSVREGAGVLLAAAAVPLAAFAPFYLEDPVGVRHVAEYDGLPGAGGITMLLQPSLISFWLTDIWGPVATAREHGAIVDALTDNAGPITAGVFCALGAYLLWARAAVLDSAVLIWLALYVVAPSFFFQYFVWGIPFFIAAGRLREVVALQAILLVPMLLFYRGPRDSEVAEVVYFVFMAAVWAAMLVAFVRVARGIALKRRSAPSPAA